MVSTAIACGSVLLYLAWAVFLYRYLAARMPRTAIGSLSAVMAYWLALATAPWVFMWLGVRLGWYIYQSFPSVREASWDVRLALVVYFAMALSYIVGIVSACVGAWFFASRTRDIQWP